jgi:Zn-dependent alcohol dehydrogenase
MQLGEGAFTLRSCVSRRWGMSWRGRVSMCGCVSMCDCGAVCDRMSVPGRNRVTVRGTDSVHLVPTGIVAVVSAAMMSAAMMRATVTARKAKERHGSHPGRTKNNAEDVKIHRPSCLRSLNGYLEFIALLYCYVVPA